MAKSRKKAGTPKVRILIVDDHEDSGETLCALLEALGFDCTYVTTGEDAIARAATFRPHAVLMDIGLPGIDGYNAARRIRSLPEGGRITVIAVTGWGAPRDVVRGVEAGMTHHLTKPVDIKLLTAILKEIGGSISA